MLIPHSLETSTMIRSLCVNYDENITNHETFIAPKAALVSVDCTFKVANGQENRVSFLDLLLLHCLGTTFRLTNAYSSMERITI